MTGFFGPQSTGWTAAAGPVTEGGGDLDGSSAEEFLPTEIDLGGGITLKIDPDVFRKIMHTPEVTGRVADRVADLAQAANDLAVVEGAKYVGVVSTRSDNIRARGRIKPANAKAVRDDALNSTLLKALASVGSDPKPPPPDDDEEPDERPEEDDLNDELEPEAEPAAPSVLEDVAEVAEEL